jgi:hypothetical protein
MPAAREDRHMKPSTIVSFLVAVGVSVLLLRAPALAAYCGPAADTQAVESLTMSQTLPDRSRIMYLSVNGAYAMSDVELGGEESLYFTKVNGTWVFTDHFPPHDLPAETKQRFDAIMNTTPHPCANPNFINHPSGP